MSLPDLTQLTLIALESARQGDEKTLRDALGAGVTVDAAEAGGRSLLILACCHGHASLATMLLERGANPNARDVRGRTALMVAAASGQAPLVHRLLVHGADPSVRDATGARAADLAAAAGADEVVSLLGG